MAAADRPLMLSLLDSDSAKTLTPKLDSTSETEDRNASRRAIRCAACGAEVTNEGHRIPVDGRHEHVFTNPHGYVFHIACFRDAPGVAPIGPESDEWAWFAGTVWRRVVCRSCFTHLGWSFHRDDTKFFGLISASLTQ